MNKQKFLAELAKLLTFMFEDDRQRALAAYTEMFEEAGNEQLLLQSLVSPLRQAVEVARAYNSGKHRLAPGQKRSAPEDSEHPDAFLEVIDRVRGDAMALQPSHESVDENQFSLFDAPAAPEVNAPEAEPEEAPAEAEAAPEEATAEAETEAAPEETPAEAEAESEPEETPAEAEAEAAPEEAPAAEAPAVPAAVPEEAPAVLKAPPARPAAKKTVRKPRVLLLIPYILIAAPLTLLAALLLLVPALASLGASAMSIISGILTISYAIGSFPTLANLLVVLGAALVLLALGLVFLMLFIWFLGGAIGGVIRGVIKLGRKWCWKEVAAA